MGDLYFDGDPARDSTRRRLERVLKEEPVARERPQSAWPWKTTLLAGGTAFLWWQLRRRRLRREAEAEAEVADAKTRDLPPVER
jgi:hypothetical protein